MKTINVAELLKDCPKGMELDCTMFDNVKFDSVNDDSDYPITLQTEEGPIYLTKHGYYENCKISKCVIFPKGKTTWEGFVPPYKFKDGDVVTCGYNSNTNTHHWTCILKEVPQKINDNYFINDYCSFNSDGIFLPYNSGANSATWVRLATEEEKQRLLKAIKDKGYEWNVETKTLKKAIVPKFKVGDIVQYITDDTDKRKIMEIDTLCNKYHTDSYSIRFEVEDDWKLVSNKFDINTLKHFERVLVRNCSTDEWDIDFFGYYNRGLYHTTGKSLFKQCIPYKNNEHMVGTSIDCDDFYKNWED